MRKKLYIYFVSQYNFSIENTYFQSLAVCAVLCGVAIKVLAVDTTQQINITLSSLPQ